MQKGMNQTVAWLIAVFSASALFSLGAFMISKYHPNDQGDEQHLSAKAHDSHEAADNNHGAPREKKKNAKPAQVEHKSESAEKGGEVLRPDDMDHTPPHH